MGDIPPKYEQQACPTCNGSGESPSVTAKIRAELEAPRNSDHLCDDCDGDGCESCGFSGIQTEKKGPPLLKSGGSRA